MNHTAPLLLPCCAKDLTAADNPNSDHNLHPLGKLLRKRRFAQAALGMSIALAASTAWFRYDDSRVVSPKLIRIIIAAVLAASSAVVWNVRLVAMVFPAITVGAERAGLAALFFPFFAVVNGFLEKGVVIGWVPWACLVGTVLIVTSVRVAPPPVITFKAFNWVR